MNHIKQDIEEAISRTGLSSRHQKSLLELVGLRKHPLFLGYFVYAVGIACFIAFITPIVLSTSFNISMACEHPELSPHAISEAAGIPGVYGLLLMFSFFLMSGAQTYISRIRSSRAVVELLMRPAGTSGNLPAPPASPPEG